jgi:hypothetical protein
MNQPSPQAELPATRTLIRSTLIAGVVAAVILVLVVLPAEYGIDPTRIGGVLGLTEMGETKTALAQEVATDASQPIPSAAATPCPPAVPAAVTAGPGSAIASPTRHSTRVTLKPGEGKEVKLTMRAGATVSFSWSTDRGVVNYDLHSDDPTTGKYHGYGKGKGLRQHEGVLVAAFAGSHGWFWRNRTNEDITITLDTTGDYQEVNELK